MSDIEYSVIKSDVIKSFDCTSYNFTSIYKGLKLLRHIEFTFWFDIINFGWSVIYFEGSNSRIYHRISVHDFIGKKVQTGFCLHCHCK